MKMPLLTLTQSASSPLQSLQNLFESVRSFFISSSKFKSSKINFDEYVYYLSCVNPFIRYDFVFSWSKKKSLSGMENTLLSISSRSVFSLIFLSLDFVEGPVEVWSELAYSIFRAFFLRFGVVLQRSFEGNILLSLKLWTLWMERRPSLFSNGSLCTNGTLLFESTFASHSSSLPM